MNAEKGTKIFSGIDRAEAFAKLKGEIFDVLVIGGGATGCGIALDAASRGLKTILVEKEDFAAGTSSKSTKLIHGGLRYLKQLEFGLVRESGMERAMLNKLAPHLVIPEKMILPITKGGTYGKWAAAFGVMVYDMMAGVTGDDRRVMLSKDETLKLEPLIKSAGLKGACFYAEYRTDDARLTIELIKRASTFGARAFNYCAATSFIYEKNKIRGVVCQDVLTNKEYQINARQVVSAGGPWVDVLREKDQSKKGKSLHLTKGVHLVFPHAKIPLQHSVYFDIPDGRMIFAIPRGKVTYVGTTDTSYTGDLNKVVATKADLKYLLDAVNFAFPQIKVEKTDVISNWAGLRPLIHEHGKSPSELSRKDEIFESASGLISIAGGKLTGYRKMAQRIVDKILKKDGGKVVKCVTDKIYLTEPALKDNASVLHFIEVLTERLERIGLTSYVAWYLVTAYGRQAELILDKMDDFSDVPELALARAETWFCVHFEMVNSLTDFFIRRTSRMYFDIKSIAKIREIVSVDFANYLQWNAVRMEEEVNKLDDALQTATCFYDRDFMPAELVAHKG